MRAQAVLGGLLVALLAPAVSHAANGDGLLEPTILVDTADGSPVESKTTLVAGRTYTIAVEGYYFETIPTTDGGTFTYTYDGVYCFEGSTSTSVCSRATPRLFDGGGLRVRIGTTGDFGPFYRELGAFTGVPAFKEGNNYFRDFTPTATGRLQMTIARDLRDSYRGALRVLLYGPLSPDSPGPPGSDFSPELQDLLNSACQQGLPLGGPIFRVPSLVSPPAVPTASAAATATATKGFCPTRLPKAPGWGRPATLPSLAPGDEAIAIGPAISAAQREATITVSTTTGDVAVALTEDDAKFRRFARRACLFDAARSRFVDLVNARLESSFDDSLSAGAFVEQSGLATYLLPCLKMIDDALARKAGAARAHASATSCLSVAFPIKAVAGKTLDTVSLRTRRSYPLPNVLRVSCSKTRAGIVVRVRPRQRGRALRTVVGKRLSVGLVRAPNAKATARGTITFRR